MTCQAELKERGMRFELQLSAGPWSTRDGFVRVLPHEMGSIYIIDQLFEPDFVKGLHAVCKRLAYIANDIDTEAYKHIRHWKCELPAQTLMEGDIKNRNLLDILPKQIGAGALSMVARIINAAMNECYTGYKEISINRVHVNCLPYGDLLNTHQDGEVDLTLTGLYFANAEWQASWHGELVLSDVLGESLYAIEPRPGRIVLFPGEIPHRAGVPSRACYEHRFSIGHKFDAVRQK